MPGGSCEGTSLGSRLIAATETLVTLVPDHPRPHAAPEPAAALVPILSYPGFVMEPDLKLLGPRIVGRDLRKRGGEDPLGTAPGRV